MNTTQKDFWWIDAILFVGFLLAYFLNITGVGIHQWIGIFGGLLAAYHLLSHWNWVTAVSQRFFSKANLLVRLKYIVDGSLFVGFLFIICTGLVISSWLNINLTHYSSWLSIHIWLSILTLLMLLLKIGLHWKWISRATRSALQNLIYLTARLSSPQSSSNRQLGMDRREFLRVMGVTGGGVVLACVNAGKGLAALQGVETITDSQTDPNIDASASDAASSDTTASDSSSWISQFVPDDSMDSSTCTVQCGKRCSYPGHCRRYTDSDNDNYCDFGECA